MSTLQQQIEQAWEDRSLLETESIRNTIESVIDRLDRGELRCAEPLADGSWQVNEWVKKAVILYFPIRKMEVIEAHPFVFHDKIPLKTNYEELGVRVVPHAIARYGAFLERGVIMMPSYVNIGAWVGAGSMVDTWATVGSCAQIGRGVHLSGGVGIGGVLEPVQASPVIHRRRQFYRVTMYCGGRRSCGKGSRTWRQCGPDQIHPYYRCHRS